MKKLYENDLRFYNYDPLFNTKQLELHLLPGKYCKDLSHNDKISLIAALHLTKTAIEYDFFKGYSLTQKLPTGVKYKKVADCCANKFKNINWLDPLR